VKGSFISTIQGALVTAVASIGIVILLWYGSKLCIMGTLSLSDLFIFYYMLGYFLSPVQNLVALQPQIQTAMVAADRLNDILEIEAENNTKNKADNLKGDIVMKDIDFRYGNRELILNDLSMTFKSGTKTAIVGESGSGKTTISKLLMAFYKQEKGTLTINDVPIEDYSPYSLRNRIAYISQNTFLFADTVYNNLRMGNEDITNEMIEEMCKKCMADEFIRKLPLGYDTKIEENGNNLSGGQKQRLAIARALLRNPDILIMDEATSNMDSISERKLKQTIDNITSEITCIIIAHRLKTIRNCDKIYVLKNGTVIEQGTHEELIALNGEYAKNWE
jgi:ATP-binding cassette subfamily B protein